MSEDRHAEWGPHPRFDDPAVLSSILEQRLLPLVSRPGRYLGGELGAEPPERWRPHGCNVLLCFPDAYEIGMSHTGLRILYSVLNDRNDTYCDLAFAPWMDLEELMRREGMPLFGLQTRRPARQFDVIGFSLGYELGYTNVLTMLSLAAVPLRSVDRRMNDPLIVAGGACVMNPAVMGPFFDVMLPGDGEEVLGTLASVVAAGRRDRKTRDQILSEVRGLSGVWWPQVSEPVKASVLSDLNRFPLPRDMVPTIEPVHDRLTIEVMRGCTRGCRFCQAGMIQRPVRERDVVPVVTAASRAAGLTGYGEVGLLSLSTGDYSGLGPTIAGLESLLRDQHTNLVLPSLRMETLDSGIRAALSKERPASVTFAPEAGTQRLRDVINKQLTEPQIMRAAAQAVEAGVKNIKLYFMIGLPTETDEDLAEIIKMTGRLAEFAKRGGCQVTVSISPFSPKAHTPFQWAGQISRDEIDRRNKFLSEGLRSLHVKVSLRKPEVSFLEAALGLGDTQLADVVESAWREGARFDGWDECFSWDCWIRAFKARGCDLESLTALRDPSLPLPWDNIEGPVSRAFLTREWQLAHSGRRTSDCRLDGACEICGACHASLRHVGADPAVRQVAQPVVLQKPGGPNEPGAEHPRWRSWRERASAKIWCRIEYAKCGSAIFLGHLDFQRHLQLALRRSGLPVAYSKGYHPHPLVKFGPPLAVGVAGKREALDLAFLQIEPDWVLRLRDAMPPGLDIKRGIVSGSATPAGIDAMVERCDYEIMLPVPDEGGPRAVDARRSVEDFLAAEELLWARQRPDRPAIEVDVRSLVLNDGLNWMFEPCREQVGLLRLSLKHDNKGGVLPVHDVLAAVFGVGLTELRWCSITRTGLFARDFSGRWLSPFTIIRQERQRIRMRAHLND